MYDFNYHRPKSLADAQAALKGKCEARPMSGGMTLIPTLKQRLAKPGTVFIAVGAGHLAGNDSVQAQLAKHGIKAQRIAY